MAKDDQARGWSQTASLLSSARSLIALQLVSRLVTFALNQALVRLASARVFGTASIQFDLLRDTILFLSRESVRGVISRIPRQGSEARKLPPHQVRNLLYLPGLLSLPITAVVVGIYYVNLSHTTSNQDGFAATLALYIFSTLIETVLVEPIFLYSLIEADEPNVAVRVRAEGAAVIVKAVATTSLLAYFTKVGRPSQALLCFGIGQLSFALTLLVRFASHYRKNSHERRAFAPIALVGGRAKAAAERQARVAQYDAGHLRLVGAMTAQSLFKHFLTEGDRLVVAWTSPLDDQGGYAVASNYASLVARIVFQPIEESSRLYFSRTLGTGGADTAQPFNILTNLVRVSLFLLAICPAFIPPFAPVVLPYLLPRQYLATSALKILTAYLTIYLPILSLNGILESFFAATSGVRGLGRQSVFLVICSGGFTASLWGLSRLREHLLHTSTPSPSALLPWLTPETSLVYANCLQMLLRIAFAGRHATRLYRQRTFKQRVRGVKPSWAALATVGVAGVLLRHIVDKVRWQDDLLRRLATIGVGGVCGLICAGLFAWQERRAWTDVLKSSSHVKAE